MPCRSRYGHFCGFRSKDVRDNREPSILTWLLPVKLKITFFCQNELAKKGQQTNVNNAKIYEPEPGVIYTWGK